MADTTDYKPLSDEQRLREFMTRARSKMQWCREKAAEYHKAHPRRKFYKLTYDFCGERETYACLSDEDIKRIQDMVAEEIAENGPFANAEERKDFLGDNLDEVIDWSEYLPEEHARSIDAEEGERTRVTDIDFDDYVYCSEFTVKCSVWYKDDKKDLHEHVYNIDLTDDEWIELVAFRLFDPKLTFLDLRELDKALYDRIEANVYTPHDYHLIYMTEVNDAADAISKSNVDDENARPLSSGVFHPIAPIWYDICNHPELAGDEQLKRAIKLALYTGEI